MPNCREVRRRKRNMTMKLYKASVKRKTNLNEKMLPGMEVEVPCKSQNPLNNPDDMKAIADAFKNKYGVDVSNIQILNNVRVEKQSSK